MSGATNPPLTTAEMRALAGAPLCQLRRWLLQHARCSLIGRDTLTLDPPRWRYGRAAGLRGPPLSSAAVPEADLTTDLAVTTSRQWWLSLTIGAMLEWRASFIGTDCLPTREFQRCSEALGQAVQFCVLLDEVSAAGGEGASVH